MHLHHEMARQLVADRQQTLRREAKAVRLGRLARLARRNNRADRRRRATARQNGDSNLVPLPEARPEVESTEGPAARARDAA